MSLRPPGGTPPPTVAELGDEQLDLVALASEVCARYLREYPDEPGRYGVAGADWCRHDNQWLLSWAVGDVLGTTSLDEQVSWLARVLHARGFPLQRLAHDLRLAGEVAQERLPEQAGAALCAALMRGAATVASLELAQPAVAGA